MIKYNESSVLKTRNIAQIVMKSLRDVGYAVADPLGREKDVGNDFYFTIQDPNKTYRQGIFREKIACKIGSVFINDGSSLLLRVYGREYVDKLTNVMKKVKRKKCINSIEVLLEDEKPNMFHPNRHPQLF